MLHVRHALNSISFSRNVESARLKECRGHTSYVLVVSFAVNEMRVKPKGNELRRRSGRSSKNGCYL